MLEIGLAALGARMIRTHDVARLRRLVDHMVPAPPAAGGR
jgi:hypothetical protein